MARTTNTRASSTNTRAAKPQRLEDVEVKATVVDEPTTAKSEAWAAFEQARERVMAEFGICSVRRYFVALVASFIASCGASYLTMAIIDIVMTGALALTGSAFLALIIWVLGIIAAVAAAYFAGGAAFKYVATEKVDAHIAVVSSVARGAFETVRGFFGGNAKPVSA